jgi:hypothetical protein
MESTGLPNTQAPELPDRLGMKWVKGEYVEFSQGSRVSTNEVG